MDDKRFYSEPKMKASEKEKHQKDLEIDPC
jgi:hypothetical protein